MTAPPWGLDQGWEDYVAALFNWVLDRPDSPITKDQAGKCATRDGGYGAYGGWESVDKQLVKLGECVALLKKTSCLVQLVGKLLSTQNAAPLDSQPVLPSPLSPISAHES